MSSLRVVRFFTETQVRLAVQKNKAHVGKWMREELAELGPAYIKFGQFLSTRPDLVGKEVVRELELLQDDIKTVPFFEIEQIIQASLKDCGVEDAFSYIDPIPIASASIGQVHRGRLSPKYKDAGLRNANIVIKVQKPLVAKLIQDDLNTLKNIITLLQYTGSSRATEISSIVGQYEKFLSAELDFSQELKYMHRFIDIVEDGDLPVKVPKPIDIMSTSSMLVMEYVPSIKIDDITTLRARGFDTRQLAQSLMQSFLYQIITAAVVHCDPHPGNIGVLDDGVTLVFYDFGNVVELSGTFKTELNQLVFAMYQKDVDEFVRILVKLKILNVTTEADIMEAKVFFKSFLDYLETLDVNTMRDAVTTGDFARTLETKLKLDTDIFSILRVFSLLDGTCAKLEPAFNYIDALSPFTNDLIFDMNFLDYRARRDFDKVRAYPSMLQSTDMNISRMQGKMKDIEDVQGQAKSFLIIYFIIENINDPAVIAGSLGLVLSWWLYSTKIRNRD
jgi:ubiquinone biosynthesis protein